MLANETSVARVALGRRSSGAMDGSVRLSETDVLRAAVTKAANFPKLRHRCSVVRSFILSSLLLPRPTDQSSQLLALLSSCCRCSCCWLSQKADANSRSLARFSHSDTAPLPNPPLVTAKPLKTHQRLLLNSPFNLTHCLSYCSLHLHASCWPQHPPPLSSLTRDPANGTSQYCRGAKDTVHFTSPYPLTYPIHLDFRLWSAREQKRHASMPFPANKSIVSVATSSSGMWGEASRGMRRELINSSPHSDIES